MVGFVSLLVGDDDDGVWTCKRACYGYLYF
jgi:hypothetical protein